MRDRIGLSVSCALLAALGTTALTKTLVAGGAAGIVYLATSANSDPR